ncbi:V-type ATP synthase subunit D [Mucilaginibacter sp.]|uniref:V-type ATP synthase subunit D n=1 Tax=Mucilaginibacter sp. TaxID=1882438 RepID=UPI00374CA597
MAIKFQYNKISLQEMQQQLKVRLDALPVIKYKEAILRAEAEKAKKKMVELEDHILNKINQYQYMNILWKEFPPDAVAVREIKTSMKNIAGVKTPQLESVEFELKPLCLFTHPLWISNGITLIKELASLSVEKQLLLTRTKLLDDARKKTTQKVNLYEKVQVPGYHNAILKIKKFMNDEESLGKAVQKIMKKRILSI